MVTGGVDVSRSSVIVDHTKKDYECYRNGSRGLYSRRGSRHVESCQNRCYKSSYESGRTLGVRQRKDGCHDSSSGLGLVHGRGEAQEDGGVQLPPEKRRKFSPIIWDIEDKVIRDQTRSETKTVVNLSSLPRSVDELSKEIEDEAVIASRQHNLNDPEEGRTEEEGEAQAPNIATSRWASSLDSPKEAAVSDGDRILKTSRWNKSCMSPESGEFLVEKSEGRESQSSRSAGGCLSVELVSAHEYSDNELESHIDMEIDEAQSGSSHLSQSEDVESTSSTQGGKDMLLGSRSVDEYEKLRKISEGTYGVVYKARDKKTGEIVALKKIKMNDREDEYGFPLTSLREINILLSCHHPSIVNVKEVVVGNWDTVFMVMEHLEHDLKSLMDRMKLPFSTSEVKCLMIQLLEGVKYLHHNWIIHRDLKPSNLLMNNSGELKICDFGMSRQYGSPLKPYTQLVVTQWYRAPELLLGAKQYSTAIDMWSVGCIMAELLSKKPLFQGKGGSDIDQLNKIFAVLGTPSEVIWPGFSSLPGGKANFFKQPYNLLRKKFPAASFTGSPVLSDLGFDLLNRLLAYDPEKRLTVDEALNHEWFCEVPLPKSKEFMPTFPFRRD